MGLESPRLRRRLAVGALLTALVAALGLVAVLPDGPTREQERFHGAADLVSAPTTKVTPPTRRSITSTLRRFARAGLAREDLAAAWDLAGPELRGSTSRSTWLAGSVPFVGYHARPFGPDAWQVVDALPGRVVLDLFVQPAPEERGGPTTFTVAVERLGQDWKVQSVYASVVFSGEGERPGVIAANDFAAAGAPDPRKGEARLAAWWLLAPVVGLLLVLGALVAVVTRARHAR